MSVPPSSSASVVASATRVMVLTSDVRTSTMLSNSLRSFGCQVTRVASLPAAIETLRGTPHDLLLLDLVGDEDRVVWIPRLIAGHFSLTIVGLVDQDRFAEVVRCVRAGAQECLPKPVDPARLRHLVVQPMPDIDGTGSTASCMRLAMESIRRAAQSDHPVMLRGEHGTGKTMFAEFLHRQSRRSAHPFVTVNCPSLSAELAVSELFGHRKGAFTGAVADQLGKVEAAEWGSLFLDEIGDLPAGVQPRILRFLQDRAFERLGETMTRHADVRLITATNRDLEALMDSGAFRPDLFYRLSGIEITIPPLRERRNDIVVLAHRFLREHAATHGRRLEFAPGTTDVLAAYDWPGNVRELHNEIQRAVVMTTGHVIRPEDLSARLLQTRSGGVFLGGDFTLRQIGDEHVARVLRRHPRVGQVAQVLDIERSTLLVRRRRLGFQSRRSSLVSAEGGGE